MSKLSKVLLSILLMFLCGVASIAAWDYNRLYSYEEYMIPSQSFPGIGPYSAYTLSIIYLIIAIALFISIFVVIFWPNNYISIKRERGKGTLEVKASAIKGYVECILDEDPTVYKPSVNVTLKKRRVDIDVTTQIPKNVKVNNVAKTLEFRLRNELRDFLGVNQDPNVKVRVYKQESTRKTPRVV